LGTGAGRAPWSSIGILGHRNQNRSHAAPIFQMLGLDLPVPDKTTPAQGSAAADDSTEEAKTTGKPRDRLQRAEDLGPCV